MVSANIVETIAFGTNHINEAIEKTAQGMRPSYENKENVERASKAKSESLPFTQQEKTPVATELSVKRNTFGSKKQEQTTGGKPTVEDKTTSHRTCHYEPPLPCESKTCL